MHNGIFVKLSKFWTGSSSQEAPPLCFVTNKSSNVRDESINFQIATISPCSVLLQIKALISYISQLIFRLLLILPDIRLIPLTESDSIISGVSLKSTTNSIPSNTALASTNSITPEKGLLHIEVAVNSSREFLITTPAWLNLQSHWLLHLNST